MRDKPVIRLLNTYCRAYAGHFVAAVVTMLTARLLWLYPPVVVGVLFDALLTDSQPFSLPLVPSGFVPPHDEGRLVFSLTLVGGFYLLGAGVYVVGSLLRSVAAYRVQHELRTDTYEQIQQLSYRFFEERETGDLISIVNNDVNNLQSFLNGTLQLVGNVVFVLVGVTAYMIILQWQLALVAFLAPALISLFNYWYSRYVEPRYQRLRANVGDITTKIENNLSGIDVIKAYTREEFEEERVEELSAEYRTISWQVTKVRIALGRVTGQLSNLGYLAVLYVGSIWVLQGPPLVFSGDLAAGTLLTFLLYNRHFQWPLSNFTTIVDKYENAKASSRRVFDLLDEEPEVDETDGEPIDVSEGRVELEGVTFRYGEDQAAAVEKLELLAESEETIGIVGESGAGKSTLSKLLFGLYRPDEGRISVDGTDIWSVSPQSYREEVGYVSQEPYLIAGTVSENIRYGAPEASDEAVVEAARLASAHQFVTALPDGYDTEVGEGGGSLSGGQRQRIAIARALVGDPTVVVFDEATSDVDNETTLAIRQAIREATADVTTFVTAHDLATVRHADRIFVMEDGQFVERGDHRSLVDEDGTYARLWQPQTGKSAPVHASSD